MLRLFKMEPFLLEYLKLHVYLCFLSNYKVLLNYYAFKNIGEKTRSLLLNKYLFCEAVKKTKNICSVQFSSVSQSCLTLCDPMNHSMPGLPIHHQLPEFTQTVVHWVSDAIQPSHPLLSPSLPSFSLSQHQGFFHISQFFASGGQSIGVSASASVLPVNIQDLFPLGWTDWISLLSEGLKRMLSNTTVQRYQFFGAQLSLWSESYILTWLLEKS